MERYELVEGKSSKFWEVEVADSGLTVNFGRIGTAGQSKTRQFADAAAAQAEYLRLVREKTQKGYVLAVERAGGPAATPVAAPPTPGIPVSPTDGVPGPTDGVRWNAAWDGLLPPVRGIHVSPLPAAPQPLPYDEIPPEALAAPDIAIWVPLLRQLNGDDVKMRMQRRLGIALDRHGIAFALRALIEAWEAAAGRSWAHIDLVPTLAHALAACPDPEYRAALAYAEQARPVSELGRRICAAVFRHVGEWAEEYVQAPLAYWERPLFSACAMTPQAFARMVRNNEQELGDGLFGGALLQLRLHGEAALEGLEALLATSIAGRRAAAQVERVLSLITSVRVPRLPGVLVRHVDHRSVREALEKLAAEFPAAVLQAAIEQVGRGTDGALESWTARVALQHPEPLRAALAAVEPRARARFEARFSQYQIAEAPADRVPRVLREPPWLRADRRELPSFVVEPIATPEVLTLDAGERAQAEKEPKPLFGRPDDGKTFPHSLGLTESGEQALRSGQPLPEDGIRQWQGRQAWLTELFACPPHTRLNVWNHYPAKHWSRWLQESDVHHLFVRHGFAAMPGLLGWFRVNPDHAARLAPAFDSPRLVPLLLEQMLRGRKHRDAAAQWVRTHAGTVLHVALPAAFHPEPTQLRDDARQAIRFMVAEGRREELRRVASRYGATMEQAVDVFLGLDPLELLPAKLPKLPAFFVPATLRRPELKAGGALPLESLRHLATMLAISAPTAPYAGLAVVQECCTRESLASFAWDVMEAWNAAGAPARESWALRALGLLGDDRVARQLVPRIRDWAEHGAPSRGVAALDVLAAIGSDVALMHLNAFTRQTKLKPLKKRAAEMIAAVAEARGLSEEELGDRLVPTLGLDEDGALDLDYGARRFRLRFDENLAPFLTDGQGVRLKAIPRANKNDDLARAQAAIERYKHIRKEVESVASLQIARMERAMAARRRWSAADFRAFFLQHPLMRHLAARLVWGTYADGALAQTFRIAEDWSLADANDTAWELPGQATVGIPHVLDLAPALRDGWSRLFADYEIAQPLRQLGRETFALTPGERDMSRLKRFEGRRVASVGLLALNHRGWTRQSEDGAGFTLCVRALPADLQAEIFFAPGIPIGEATAEPVQTLCELVLCTRDAQGRSTPRRFGELDPLLASEVLRDLELLPPARA